MVIVNSWLLHRRDCESLCVPRKLQQDMLDFKISVTCKTRISKRRQVALDVESEFQKKKHQDPAMAILTQEVC